MNKKRKERAKEDANNKEDRDKKTMEKLQAVHSIKNHYAQERKAKMDELSHLFKKREQAKTSRTDRLLKDGLVLRELTRLR